ncbi:MAG TPA: phosphoenolpyruvate carboxylase [Pyrinomonadaceae bacterium]|nr:phosphoenolpyruvate carboxylase [Pyrinomonadaceae bacterium]
MAPNQNVPGDKFQEFVGIRFQLYNSLFLSLPFYGVDKTGILLSLFNEQCEAGFANGKSPSQIVDGFLSQYSDKTADLLFRFVQYVERQVVLFDALEDAAFPHVHDMNGPGTLGHLLGAVEQNNRREALIARLKEFSIRIVLTAHPTQFYPGAVLGIINDLVEAIEANDVSNINTLLQQLGRTPFFKKQRPTPYDEAVSQIWYLENIFYEAAGAIAAELRIFGGIDAIDLRHLLKIGFWSGGDRDGNPFVTSETTLRVAASLRRAILRCYYNDVRKLKRRLTFTGVENAIAELEHLLYDEAYRSAEDSLTTAEIKSRLDGIREVLVTRHNGLFVHLLDDLRNKVEIFGTHFVALDIRQEASVHGDVLSEIIPGYSGMSGDQRFAKLIDATSLNSRKLDGITEETRKTIDAIRTIQSQNGPNGCERYIISQCRSALNVMEVYGLFLLGGWKKENIAVDIVPLFETISDLENAAVTMRELYELPAYREHLSRRGDRQTIMLGFSDGTKDGGYLMANWSIYKAKDELTKLAREHGITVIFFDGRGGPPARGGGKTHKFYSSMGENIADEAIEITVQGQTISSNFGTPQSARFNIEQLLNSGVYNHIFAPKDTTFQPDEESLLARLARESFAAYDELKNHPGFLKYLSDVSPLRFYAQANIGSRPAKRGSGELTLQDLRAIPFVGAWSQLKQNVPGFYGVGTALKKLETEIDAVKAMYRENLFFKALIDNCEMAMQKSFFGLTAFLADDPRYGPIWRKIHDEFELTRHYLGIVTGTKNLMSDLPVEQQSVSTRERVVLPLITIQQYALTRLRNLRDSAEKADERSILEKLVIRCSFGIINAGRNSA